MAGHEISFFDILTKGTYGFFIFTLIALFFILTLLWIILPFAVFKIKNILIDTNINLIRILNRLADIEERLSLRTPPSEEKEAPSADEPFSGEKTISEPSADIEESITDTAPSYDPDIDSTTNNNKYK